MNDHRNARIGGLVLHVLIGGIMILSALMKFAGQLPEEVAQSLQEIGLGDRIILIGAGELTSAVLLIVPRTLSLGVLLVSGFWGGAICVHLAEGSNFAFQSALLILTWVGAWLRCPALLASFRPGRPGASASASGGAPSPAHQGPA